MALRGNLKDFSLPDVFQLVQLSGKTGVLRIAGPDAEGSIWFRDGNVFFAQSNWRREQLGERLVNAQRITPAALARALEVRASEGEGGRRLGEILVNEGYITEQVLEAFVQEQIQDTIFDIMRWDEGEFDFEVLPDVVHEDIGLSVSVENIVMEGSRRLEEWQRIKKKVPSTDMVFKMATAPGEGTFEISLKPIEWALLLLIDGTRSVRELATQTRSTDFEVARVIYGLFSAGLLEVTADEEVERLRAERAQREDKRAALESTRAAREAEQSAQALDLEAQLAATAEARRAAVTDEVTMPEDEATVSEAVGEREDEAAVAEVEPQSAAEPKHVPEEPEFLVSGSGEAPTADDMAMFEQMMASVLSPASQPVAVEVEEQPEVEELPGPEVTAESMTEADIATGYELPETQPTEFEPVDEPEAAPVYEIPEGYAADLTSWAAAAPESALPGAPYMPVWDFVEAPSIQPADEQQLPDESFEMDDLGIGAISGAELADIPAAPVAEAGGLPEQFVSTGDFETDLRSLGLGEYPEELLQPQGEPSVSDLAAEEYLEAESVPEGSVEPEEAPASDDSDLDSLLASLETATPVSEGVIASDTEYGERGDTSGGVISTDAFLAEFDSGAGLSGGLGDELTALTGGGPTGRSRPVATVNKLPEPGQGGHMIQRDQMVDRSLVEKIIEGIENL